MNAELNLEEPMTKSAVALRQDDLPGVPEPAIATSMIEAVLRAARDPNVDVDKMERLMALAERMEGRQAEQAFNEAMNEVQKDLRMIVADASNPQTRSKYASYVALDKVLRPLYTQHGFALSFDTGDSSIPEIVRVRCRVSHRDGHSRDYHIDMPADGKGAKGGDVMTKTHATGAALSYGSRYLLKLIFNVAVGEDDDDGNSAGSSDPLSEEDMEWIKDMIEKSHSDLEKFCSVVMKVGSLSELTKRDMPKAREALNEALNYWQRKNPKAK